MAGRGFSGGLVQLPESLLLDQSELPSLASILGISRITCRSSQVTHDWLPIDTGMPFLMNQQWLFFEKYRETK
jgi:hypothetical protein